MKPTLSDRILHALSLQIAVAYTQLDMAAMDDEALQDIILAYRSIRRHISKGKDEKRYGAEAAHKMMQGGI